MVACSLTSTHISNILKVIGSIFCAVQSLRSLYSFFWMHSHCNIKILVSQLYSLAKLLTMETICPCIYDTGSSHFCIDSSAWQCFSFSFQTVIYFSYRHTAAGYLGHPIHQGLVICSDLWFNFFDKLFDIQIIFLLVLWHLIYLIRPFLNFDLQSGNAKEPDETNSS